MAMLLMAQQAPASLDQVKSVAKPDHRAHGAIEFAMAAERDAEAAYDKNDMAAVQANLKSMMEAIDLARDSLEEWGKSASRHPGPYKFAETRSNDMLMRLSDFQKRMDESDRPVVDAVRSKLQTIHDAWFDAIMEKRK